MGFCSVETLTTYMTSCTEYGVQQTLRTYAFTCNSDPHRRDCKLRHLAHVVRPFRVPPAAPFWLSIKQSSGEVGNFNNDELILEMFSAGHGASGFRSTRTMGGKGTSLSHRKPLQHLPLSLERIRSTQ